jgi:hypothetical protein
MQSMNTRASVLVITAALGASCLGRQLTFDRLRAADRIDIRTNHQQPLRTIRDPEVIDAARDAVARHDAGWKTPWYGSPVPRLQVSFFHGTELVGGYGVGKDFLTTESGPALLTRPVPPEEAARIAQILGVPITDE